MKKDVDKTHVLLYNSYCWLRDSKQHVNAKRKFKTSKSFKKFQKSVDKTHFIIYNIYRWLHGLQQWAINIEEWCNGSTTDSDSVCWGSNPYSPANTSEQFVPRLFYARIPLFTVAFGHFFFALKYFESFWEILRDSRFQNSKVILVRFGAFMTETFERHRSNQNRNTNWNEQKTWETFQKIKRA